MSLGSYMYHNVSKSNVACQDTSLSDNITVRKWGLPYNRDPLDPSSATKVYIDIYSTIHDGGHTTVKEGYY